MMIRIPTKPKNRMEKICNINSVFGDRSNGTANPLMRFRHPIARNDRPMMVMMYPINLKLRITARENKLVSMGRDSQCNSSSMMALKSMILN